MVVGAASRIVRLTMLWLAGVLLLPASWTLAEESPSAAPTHWRPTFIETFETLDFLRWSTAYWWGGRYNTAGELQMYVDPMFSAQQSLSLSPFSIADGMLTIQADRVSPQVASHLEGRHYISGMLTTEKSFSQLYGYFEMRARFPFGRGLWPAFWMASADRSWPPEIDIVEVLGDQPTTLYATIHFGTKRRPLKRGFPLTVANVTSDFHTYGVLWTPQFVAWYFDGNHVADAATPKGMHRPMYLLVNLAVGGKWPGSPDDTTKFPAKMQISYIKVYAMPP